MQIYVSEFSDLIYIPAGLPPVKVFLLPRPGLYLTGPASLCCEKTQKRKHSYTIWFLISFLYMPYLYQLYHIVVISVVSKLSLVSFLLLFLIICKYHTQLFQLYTYLTCTYILHNYLFLCITYVLIRTF